MKLRLIMTLALLAAGMTSFAQIKEKRIDSLLTSIAGRGKLNGNVLVAEKGKIIYLKSFGLANEVTKEKVSENSIFELASCSKQFTAMGIMILKERGLLKLDDNVLKYLPELSFYNNITIRNLLNHTAGLPDYMGILDTLFDKSRIATNKDVIAIFARVMPPLEFEAETRFKYSNTGYVLLASIIEKVSGIAYGDFLKKNIFQPLKMNSTFVYNRRLHPKEIAHYAYGYLYSRSLQRYILPDSVEKAKMVYWLDGIVGDGLSFDKLHCTTQKKTNKVLTTEIG